MSPNSPPKTCCPPTEISPKESQIPLSSLFFFYRVTNQSLFFCRSFPSSPRLPFFAFPMQNSSKLLTNLFFQASFSSPFVFQKSSFSLQTGPKESYPCYHTHTHTHTHTHSLSLSLSLSLSSSSISFPIEVFAFPVDFRLGNGRR